MYFGAGIETWYIIYFKYGSTQIKLLDILQIVNNIKQKIFPYEALMGIVARVGGEGCSLFKEHGLIFNIERSKFPRKAMMIFIILPIYEI